MAKTQPALADHPMFHHYFDYCVKSLTTHGQHVAEKLVTERHFLLSASLRHSRENVQRQASPSHMPHEALGVTWQKTHFDTCEWPTVSILFFFSFPQTTT